MVKRALPITYRQSALPGDSGRLPWGLALAGIVCLVIGASWTVRAAEAASSAYVTNAGSASVSVINTATKTVLTNISVGLTPEHIAITPNGAFAYVTNSGSNTVSVIATASNTVVGTVTVGTNPTGIAITPNGAFAYVANQAPTPSQSSLRPATPWSASRSRSAPIPSVSPSPRTAPTPTYPTL